MHRRASERGHRESRVARETRYPQYLAQTQTVRETLRLKRARTARLPPSRHRSLDSSLIVRREPALRTRRLYTLRLRPTCVSTRISVYPLRVVFRIYLKRESCRRTRTGRSQIPLSIPVPVRYCTGIPGVFLPVSQVSFYRYRFK